MQILAEYLLRQAKKGMRPRFTRLRAVRQVCLPVKNGPFQKEKGVKTLDNGAMIKLSRPGKGKTPKADSTVTVHYTGTLLDGTKFDSSRDRNAPFQTRLMDVIPCWTKAMQQMKPGAVAQVVCPADTAYGNRPVGPIPPNSVLVFDVEMISIDK